MRNRATMQALLSADPWEDVAEWINGRHWLAAGRRFKAGLIETEPGAPMLAVKVTSPTGLVATCKCHLLRVDHGARSSMVFAPLTVTWAEGRASAGAGAHIIGHLTTALASFGEVVDAPGERVFMASGNLTRAKGGKPFFEGLGWTVVQPGAREPAHLFACSRGTPDVVAAIARRIDAAVAPLRAAGRIEDEPLAFALLRLF